MKPAEGNEPQYGHVYPADKSFEEALREFLSLTRRSLALMIALCFLFASVTIFITQRMDRIYKSSTQLMIERVAMSPIDFDQMSQQRSDNGYVDGQVLLISSSDTLARVVERANLMDEPSFQRSEPSALRSTINWVKSLVLGQSDPIALSEDGPSKEMLTAVRALEDAVSLSREGDTNIIKIDARATSPELAQRIASSVADVYIEMRIDGRETEARQLSSWIDARSDELRSQLNAAERDITAYRIANHLVAMPNAISVSDQQLTEINAELIRARADLAQKRASYERFQELQAENGDLTSLPEVQNSEIVMALRASLLDLQLREQEATQNGRTETARTTQLQQQLALVEQQLNDEVLREAAVLLNETQALENRVRILATALEQAGGQSDLETQSALELNELERVAEAYRLRYERYLNNAGVANELIAFASSGTQIISVASRPVFPVYPPTKIFLVLSILAGAALALVIRLLRDTLSDDFSSIEQVEHITGCRVLAVLPELDRNLSPRDVIKNEPFSPFSEAMSVLRENLRVRIHKVGGETWAPVVLVTSAGECVGKTSIASSLAESASAGGQRVLLVDGDLRYAGLSELYDFDEYEGLCDILRGDEWLIEDDGPEAVLSVVPAGDLKGRQPTDCLAKPYLGRFIKRARQAYDLVVIDGPPVANLADCKILAEECSQVVMVMNQKDSKRRSLLQSMRQFSADKLSGVVVNFADPKDMSAGWSMSGGEMTTYGSSAQLYHLHTAELKRNQSGRPGQIGRPE